MNAQTLENWLDRLPGYKGIYPGNLFPTLTHTGDFCIINTQCYPCLNPIGHWLCIYLRSDSKIEFFDSYGNHPSFYGYLEKCVYQPFQLQAYGSTVCGHYCVLYALCRVVFNFSMHKFVRLFSKKDPVENDAMVQEQLFYLKPNFYANRIRKVKSVKKRHTV